MASLAECAVLYPKAVLSIFLMFHISLLGTLRSSHSMFIIYNGCYPTPASGKGVVQHGHGNLYTYSRGRCDHSHHLQVDWQWVIATNPRFSVRKTEKGQEMALLSFFVVIQQHGNLLWHCVESADVLDKAYHKTFSISTFQWCARLAMHRLVFGCFRIHWWLQKWHKWSFIGHNLQFWSGEVTSIWMQSGGKIEGEWWLWLIVPLIRRHLPTRSECPWCPSSIGGRLFRHLLRSAGEITKMA